MKLYVLQRRCVKCKQRKLIRGGSTKPTGFTCAECRPKPLPDKAAA